MFLLLISDLFLGSQRLVRKWFSMVFVILLEAQIPAFK